MWSTQFNLLIALACAGAYVTAFDNQIYLIRHGEKPSDGSNGLSSKGEDRSQCLVNVFGSASNYNIGYIIVQDYKSDGSRERPYETATPLAQNLGLSIDHHCDRDDTDCAKTSIDKYAKNNSENILVVWEHSELGEIGAALSGSFDYPDSKYDLIYEIIDGHLTNSSPYSEDCPGLDSN